MGACGESGPIPSLLRGGSQNSRARHTRGMLSAVGRQHGRPRYGEIVAAPGELDRLVLLGTRGARRSRPAAYGFLRKATCRWPQMLFAYH
jgi:hypothetical protein